MDVLETDRLILDKWNAKDAAQLFDYAQDPLVGRSAGWHPHSNVRESKKAIVSRLIPGEVWKIVLKESGKAIGTINLDKDRRRPRIQSRELGYSLARSCWGKGLATEASIAVVEYGFVCLGLEIISLTTTEENHRSIAVAEKLGFRYEGRERRAFHLYDDTIKDLLCYSLLKEEWAEQVVR